LLELASQPLRELDVGVARVQRRGLDARLAVGKLVLAHHGSAGAYRVPEPKCPVKTGQTLSGETGEKREVTGGCKFLPVPRQLTSAMPKPSRFGHALKSTIRAPVRRGPAPATDWRDFPRRAAPRTSPPVAGHTRAL